MASGLSSPGYDCVIERRRAVALAHHFREAEGLSIAEIAERLGRSPTTIKAYFYDPTGEKARAVKARYVGVPRVRRPHRLPRRQGRRLRVLQALPPRRDRAHANARVGARRDARGRSATAARHPQPTGLEPTRGGAAAKLSNACATEIGPHRPRSSTSTAGGQPPSPTRSRTAEQFQKPAASQHFRFAKVEAGAEHAA
jgi:hypothetical protein